jgi:hypothetical protein
MHEMFGFRENSFSDDGMYMAVPVDKVCSPPSKSLPGKTFKPLAISKRNNVS